MTTVYTYDINRVFVKAVEAPQMGQLPPCLLVPPPALTGLQVAQALVDAWVVLDAYPLPPLADLKAPELLKIDADVDTINLAVIGSRAQEYELAEQHGLAYKAAGYTGTVPSSVSSWATAKGWTATQAADDIIATASQWRTAQAAIRAQRLLRKEQVRAATDAAGITAAMAAWAGFVVAIRGQLGA